MARARRHEAPREEETTSHESGGAGAQGDQFAGAAQVPAVASDAQIAATAEEMGASNVEGMNAVNGIGAPYDVDHGVKYDYNWKRELANAGRSGEWKEEYASGHTFAPQWENPVGGEYMTFRLKKGHSASEAIQAWLTGVTVAECATAVIALQVNTLRKAIGDEAFDRNFGSADKKVDKDVQQRMVISQDPSETPLGLVLTMTPFSQEAKARREAAEAKGDGGKEGKEGKRRGRKEGKEGASEPATEALAPMTEADRDELMVPGEWYYFCNHPLYLLKHPGGAWQGENSMYMGRNAAGEQMFAGMGAADKTYDAMLEEMVSAYNLPRDEADEREMLDRKIKKPDGSYGFVYKRYDPALGKFPDQITVAELLAAKPASIGHVTRRGGFLDDSGQGMDPERVKALM